MTEQSSTVTNWKVSQRQFGTNHLGDFLLNHLVFDLIDARSGPIVPVSSVVHHGARSIEFDDQDPDAGSRLWALSEDLLGIEWKVG